MGFLLNSTLNQPYYLGAGASDVASIGLTDAALGGHAYMIDWKGQPGLVHRSVPLLKAQQDQRDVVGEQSINPEGFWRRGGDSWRRGAGQNCFDRLESDPYRFRGSQGMFVWEKWHVSLLHDTDQKRSSVNTNLKFIVAGSFFYAIDGTALVRTADITVDTPTFTAITGTPATAPTDIATDGFNIITCHGAAGIYKTTRGAAAVGGAAHITGTVQRLAFVKNRFLASNNNAIYDISTLTVGGGGALPAALFTHPNTDFVWVGFAEGDAAIYIAGVSGDKSLIYRTAVAADGTALSVPIIAGRLPDGEVVTSIYGYLGRFIFIGTNKGWRLAISSDSGDLNIGELVETPAAVRCFEGQGQFVWYGWSTFSVTATGLGRISLEEFTNTDLLVPAYASDLMVTGQTNEVLSVVTFQDHTVFAVSGVGIYADDDELVTSGYIDTGAINYNLSDPKIALFVDAQHMGEMGEHEISISVDDGPFVSLGLHHHDDFPRPAGQLEGRFFELRHTLHRDVTDPNIGLTLNSWLLLAQPKVASVTTHILATVILAPQVTDKADGTLYYDTYEELSHIAELARTKTITSWQEGDSAFSVIVEDYELTYSYIPQLTADMAGFNGSCTIKMKVVE